MESVNVTVRMNKETKRDSREYNEALKSFEENMKDMQQQSIINGTSEMTMEEIDAIIAEVRAEMRKEKSRGM